MNSQFSPNLIPKSNQDDLIMTNFKINILRSKILPCISNDIDIVIKNRRTWEYIGTTSDYLENLFIALSFIFLVVDMKIVVAINMAFIACCKHSEDYAQKRQSQLTDKINEYLKSLGIKESIIDISSEESNDSKIQETNI